MEENKNIEKKIIMYNCLTRKGIKPETHKFIITKAYDIYEIYNDWLIEHDDKSVILKPNALSIVEMIRDYNRDAFNVIPEGEYTIKEFEKIVKREFEKMRIYPEVK